MLLPPALLQCLSTAHQQRAILHPCSAHVQQRHRPDASVSPCNTMHAPSHTPAGMSGWTPASRKLSGRVKRMRSCCTLPSSCPRSGAPSRPSWGARQRSAWTGAAAAAAACQCWVQGEDMSGSCLGCTGCTCSAVAGTLTLQQRSAWTGAAEQLPQQLLLLGMRLPVQEERVIGGKQRTTMHGL